MLVIEKDNKILMRSENIWLFIAAFFALFGGIYEYFSFGIMSLSMVYAFFVPLIFGCFGCKLLRNLKFVTCMPGNLPGQVYNTGIITLTLGFLIKGVFDIYGSGDSRVLAYFILGSVMIAAPILLLVFETVTKALKNKKKQQ